MSRNARLSLLAMGLLLSLAASETRAQASHERLEISTQYTSLHLSITDSTEAGIGTRLGYNINDYLAVEAEGNYFPRYSLGNDSLDDKAQGLIGVKAGRRYGRVGAFGKLRAGVVNFYGLRIREGLCVFNPETSICRAGPRSPSRFAMDAGAVIEVYPIRRLIVRADVGDTMIRFKDDSLLDDRGIRVRAPDGISHNFQFTLAVGFRF